MERPDDFMMGTKSSLYREFLANRKRDLEEDLIEMKESDNQSSMNEKEKYDNLKRSINYVNNEINENYLKKMREDDELGMDR